MRRSYFLKRILSRSRFCLIKVNLRWTLLAEPGWPRQWSKHKVSFIIQKTRVSDGAFHIFSHIPSEERGEFHFFLLEKCWYFAIFYFHRHLLMEFLANILVVQFNHLSLFSSSIFQNFLCYTLFTWFNAALYELKTYSYKCLFPQLSYLDIRHEKSYSLRSHI